MSWQEIEGHDEIAERFRTALRRGRLASTFLFIGPAGIGKRTFAVHLAKTLLCEQNAAEELNPCGVCPACQQVDAKTHPDLEIVGKPKERNFIPIETFIGDREHRMRKGLCHNIGLKPFRGGRKIAIIDDADWLNQEGANCLLKTLEEPPPKSVIILIGTSEQKQLPTIRSRSQIIRFLALPTETVAQLLMRHALVKSQDHADNLAALSGGSIQRALDMADEELNEFRQMILLELSSREWDAFELTKAVSAYVDSAGKDAPPRRARLTTLLGMVAEFYRQLMRSLSGAEIEGDDVMQRAVHAAAGAWPGDAETAAACLEQCVNAEGYVQANANLATLVEWWLDALATSALRAA